MRKTTLPHDIRAQVRTALASEDRETLLAVRRIVDAHGGRDTTEPEGKARNDAVDSALRTIDAAIERAAA